MTVQSKGLEKRLAGRVALVTGASRGIGAAAAKAYAAEGAHVILMARTLGGLAEVDDAIRKAGGSSTVMPFNFLDLDKIEQIGPAIAQKFRRLDILVANAAMLGSLGPVALSDPKMWDGVYRLNVLSIQRLVASVDPLLRGSDAGRAIFVTSAVANMNLPHWGAYASSKAALEAMAKTYAAEVAYSPLKVNILDPGIVRTAMRAEAFPGENPESLPPPEEIVETFIRLAAPDLTQTGRIEKAQRAA